MAIKTGIIFVTLVLGCLALPKPESEDLSQFFQHVDPEARIVGGSVAAEGSHPHMIAMTHGLFVRSFLCGGSVVAQRTVLTAAHCISAAYTWGFLSNTLRVTVGTNHWNQGGQTYTLSGNATHQHYVSATLKNDIALLFTTTNIVYNDRVGPIALSYDNVGAGVTSRAAGWGRIVHQGALSAHLLELIVSTVDGPQCVTDVARIAAANDILAPAVEPHIELCVAHATGVGSGMCSGDSGSALVRVDRNAQIGIVSWGIPCARGAPDMFVRVSAYQSWLNQHIRN